MWLHQFQVTQVLANSSKTAPEYSTNTTIYDRKYDVLVSDTLSSLDVAFS